MRLPNSYGTVYKLSGKRRRPYIVRKFIGTEIDEETMKVKTIYGTIGYYATKTEALQALALYNANPTDLLKRKITFKDVYDEWSTWKYPNISQKAANTYKGCFSHCSAIHERVFKDLTVYDYEMLMSDQRIPRTYIAKIKILLNQMYLYALRHDMVSKNVADLIDVKADNAVRKKTVIFTEAEVKELKKKEGDLAADMILFSLYTGMRPAEVCSVKTENVNLEKRTIVGGMKTKAGKNRTVPIHSEILSIVKRRSEMGKKWLFTNNQGTNVKYDYYRLMFNEMYPEHNAYDTRHTFASCWHVSGPDSSPLDPLIEKLIMGHTVSDITMGVYTHITPERMLEEMEKYHIV